MRALVTILFGLAVAAHASVLTVSFNPNPLSGPPGDTLQFMGTLTNDTSNTVFINSDSFSFAIPGALDDTPFLNNAPISLGPLAMSSPFIFFQVTIPAVQAPGPYDGVFTVLGGANGNAMDNLGAGNFEVHVVTPEPASLLLCAAAGLALVVRRRKARA